MFFFTKTFADAHEWNSENDELETAMDFHNNYAGQDIGTEYNILTPEATIEAAVHAYMGAGYLKYLSPLVENPNGFNDGDIIDGITLLKFTNE